MSIVIPAGQSRTGIALSEATSRSRSRGNAKRLIRTRPLALLTVASYWAATAALALIAWFATARDSAWQLALGDGRESGDALAGSAAARTLLAWRASWVVLALAVVATVAWSRALARNARARGVPNVRPGRAAIAWCVPLIGPPDAIRRIGRYLREFDYSERRLWFWLFGFYVHTAVMVIGQAVVFVGFHIDLDDASALEIVQRQTQVLWLQAGMSGVLTLLAMRAILHADRAVTGA